jgi:ornithine cyclodeaminase
MRELWQVVSGEVSGRESDDDITLFKSLGMALWDIAAAKVVYDKAVASGMGKPLGDVS